MNIFQRIQKRLHGYWLRFKKWVLALLVAVGLIAVPSVFAVTTDWTYTRATLRVDGTPITEAEIAETRLYCDGDPTPVAVEFGASGALQAELSVGSHDCYATHVDTGGLESDPSNTVTRVVLPVRPNPPVLN